MRMMYVGSWCWIHDFKLCLEFTQFDRFQANYFIGGQMFSA